MKFKASNAQTEHNSLLLHKMPSTFLFKLLNAKYERALHVIVTYNPGLRPVHTSGHQRDSSYSGSSGSLFRTVIPFQVFQHINLYNVMSM